MPAKAAKKRNPNDATHRNIRALKTRVTKLEAAVKALKAKKPRPRDPRDDHYWRVAADRALASVLKRRKR